MTLYNARLINSATLRELTELADELADLCNRLADPLCEYEDAEELPAHERTEAREDAREQAWQILGDQPIVFRSDVVAVHR